MLFGSLLTNNTQKVLTTSMHIVCVPLLLMTYTINHPYSGVIKKVVVGDWEEDGTSDIELDEDDKVLLKGSKQRSSKSST